MILKQTPYSLLLKENIPDSIVYTDCYHRSYNALDVSEFYHYRINHSTHFAEQKNHINGIENEILIKSKRVSAKRKRS